MESETVKKAIDACAMIQHVIDFTVKSLNTLRTECSTSEGVTQKTIQEAEGKFVNYVSRQLQEKARLERDGIKIPKALESYPSIKLLLTIVGLDARTSDGIIDRGFTVESLIDSQRDEIESLVKHYNGTEKNYMDLSTALENLKKWTEMCLNGESGNQDLASLSWSVYDPPLAQRSAATADRELLVHPSPSPKTPRTTRYTQDVVKQSQVSSTISPTPYIPPSAKTTSAAHAVPPVIYNLPNKPNRPSTSSLPSDGTDSMSPPDSPSPFAPTIQHATRMTPTPPLTPQTKTKGGKPPSTPPVKRKHQLTPENYPISRSKSHESHIGHRINGDLKLPYMTARTRSGDNSRRPSSETTDNRLLTALVPSPTHRHTSASDYSDVTTGVKATLRSPGAQAVMVHAIKHQFQTIVRLPSAECHLCKRQFYKGKMCRYCRLKFHKDCSLKAPASCGLPEQFIDAFLLNRRAGDGPHTPTHLEETFGTFPRSRGPREHLPSPFQQDSPSTPSSATSSAPSSPANLGISPGNRSNIPAQYFKYPDVAPAVDNANTDQTPSLISTDSGVEMRRPENDELSATLASNDSDRSDKTLVDSSTSERIPPRLDSFDSQDEDLHNWKRQQSLSVTLKEWDIPYEEVEFLEKIGTGRFGTVHRGNWHGDVAVKLLSTDPQEDIQTQMQAFKLEVAMLRKTRHENLVLFMGACMKPPHLAIVTSLCKGPTLYSLIHRRREKMTLSRIITIASHIAQGVGYLHARDIIHKDLKTRNVFIESSTKDKVRVVITDFGLFNLTKICNGNRWKYSDKILIPKGWLAYQAPEIIRSLRTGAGNAQLPFTRSSDAYAFGTVWYELIASEMPFTKHCAESLIWQVGHGLKPPLSPNITYTKEVKDLLMSCWSFDPEDRPSFTRLVKRLEKLPQKKLLRCPSQPIQLSRSMESL